MSGLDESPSKRGTYSQVAMENSAASQQSEDQESDESTAKNTSSRNAPMVMLSALALGLAIALAHHFMNAQLNGQPVDRISLSQAWVSRFGTSLAFLAKTAFALSVGAAFVQHQWHAFHKQSLRVDEVDALTSVLGNIFSFFTSAVWLRTPSLAIMALVAWTIPLAAIVTPGSLSVAPVLFTNMTTQYVPEPLFNNSQGLFGMRQAGGGDQRVSGADRLYKLAFGTAASSQPFAISSVNQNETYSLQFAGPAVRCTPANDSIVYNATMVHGTNPYSGSAINFASWVGLGLDAYTAGGNYGSFNDTRYNKGSAPATLDYVNNDAARLWVMTNVGAWNVTRRRPLSDSVPGGFNASSIYENPNVTQVNVTECLLYNASYKVDFQFQYPNQTRQVSIVEWLNPIPAPTNYSSDDQDPVPQLAMMDAFGKLLVGRSTSGHYNTDVSIFTSWNIININWSRGELVQAGLEQLFQNFTLSILSDNQLNKNATTGAQLVPVTSTTYPITYVYEPLDLLLPYGLSFLFALLCVGMGLRAFFANGRSSFQNLFSTYLRATSDADLRALVSSSDAGADPLPKRIGKARIRMERFTKEGSGD